MGEGNGARYSILPFLMLFIRTSLFSRAIAFGCFIGYFWYMIRLFGYIDHRR